MHNSSRRRGGTRKRCAALDSIGDPCARSSAGQLGVLKHGHTVEMVTARKADAAEGPRSRYANGARAAKALRLDSAVAKLWRARSRSLHPSRRTAVGLSARRIWTAYRQVIDELQRADTKSERA